MIKYIPYILLTILAACNIDLDPNFQMYNVGLTLMVPESMIGSIEILGETDIVFTNTNKDYSFTKTTNTNGYISLNDIEAGIYTISSTKQYTVNNLTVILNGAGSINVTDDAELFIDLSAAVIGGNFVIKEYYFNGSTTPSGNKYGGDQFVDIYNNSSDTLFADSIMLVELESYGTSTNYWEDMQSDSIVVKTIWSLPKDKQYPIAPGEGFVMARDAMNHKDDPNGNTNSPVNLADAQFEFWSDKTLDGDMDFIAENLVSELWTYKGNDYAFHTRGGSALALVKFPIEASQYISDNLVAKGTVTSSSSYFCKIPNEWVIDAVESIMLGKSDDYKRMDNSLDAGLISITLDTYSGVSIKRKIEYTINNQSIYKDTNNSTFDFDTDQTPTPGVYE